MLVNFIKLIHLLIVLVIMTSIFNNNMIVKKNTLIFLVYLLFQYMSGYGKCGLTELEYLVMQSEYKQGFLYRIINPLIHVSEAYFDRYLFIVHIVYIIILYDQIFHI